MQRINFAQKVWETTKSIPCGKVATYGTIAGRIGSPRAARAVGNALNQNPYRLVPCHRVVRADGSVGGFARGTKLKIKLLQQEGIKIKNNKVERKYILNNL